MAKKPKTKVNKAKSNATKNKTNKIKRVAKKIQALERNKKTSVTSAHAQFPDIIAKTPKVHINLEKALQGTKDTAVKKTLEKEAEKKTAGQIRVDLIRPDLNLGQGVVGDIFKKPDIDIDRLHLPRTEKVSPPLMLMPMKLEYRFEKAATKSVKINREALHRQLDQNHRKMKSMRVKASEKRMLQGEHLNLIQNVDRRETIFNQVNFKKDQLLVRWYPHEGFADEGLPPLTDDEALAIEALKNRLADQKWWDIDNPESSAAWQSFVDSVGPYRAVYLARSVDKGTPVSELKSQKKYQSHIGRIVCLPKKVALYACVNNDMHLIGEGANIPQNLANEPSLIAYTPAALDPGGWLVDFKIACDNGMGVIIDDPEKLKIAKEADWIVAIGTKSTAVTDELETFFRHQIANGQMAFLPQDTPTNNTADSLSYYTSPETNILDFTCKAATNERDDFTENIENGASLLSKALDVDVNILRNAIDSNETGYEDAKAMLRVVGPAILDGSLDGKTVIKDVSENEFIDVLAASIVARGVLPAIRFGEDALGILPVTKLLELSFENDSDDNSIIELKNRLKFYAWGQNFLSHYHNINHSPVIAPGDPEGASKLDDILKQNRVSKRLDVGDTAKDDGKSARIACPYVTGKQKRFLPKNYLNDLLIKPLEKLAKPRAGNRSWPLLYRLARLSIDRNIHTFALQNIRDAAIKSPNIELKTPLSDNNKKLGTEDRKSQVQKSNVRRAEVKVPIEQLKLLNDAFKNTSIPNFATAKLPDSIIDKVAPGKFQLFQRRNREFADSLKHLLRIAERENGIAELEILLFEVIDLFQHRVDAIATGLAYAKLQAQREQGIKGVKAGYYGFIGKLRLNSVTDKGDGYIHAPSLPQATTAALIRSAYLRNRGKGAFAINLNSKRIRNALKFLDLLDKGHTIGEVLGLRGERWLHDRKLDSFILFLRALYPLKSFEETGSAERRIFDGLAFIESDKKNKISGLKNSRLIPKMLRTRLSAMTTRLTTQLESQFNDDIAKLRIALNSDLDALTDLIMAEATHQQSLGRYDIANSWLEVLSGHPPPGIPNFIRTYRKGQGSTHKFAFMFKQINTNPAMSPREIVEPALADFARSRFPQFSSMALRISISNDMDLPPMDVSLQDDLNLTPIDLVIGGVSEIQVRLRHFLHQNLASVLTPQVTQETKNNVIDMSFDISTAPGSASLETIMARVETIRKLFQNGRALNSDDLNQAAPARVGSLDESEHINSLEHSISQLFNRLEDLSTHLNRTLSNFRSRITPFITAANEYVRVTQSNVSTNMFVTAQQRLIDEATDIALHLPPLAAFGEPMALRPMTTTGVIADPEKFIGFIESLESRFKTKAKCIDKTLSLRTTSSFQSLSEARSVLNAVIKTLSEVTDGEATIILPPIRRNSVKLRPSIMNINNEREDELNNWAEFREPLKAGLDIFNEWQSSVMRMVQADATINPNDEDLDIRPETLAPSSYHFGLFAGDPSIVDRHSNLCGIVCDEWTEQRPSEETVTGIAINYDTPQAEAPYCVLLCVAPNKSFGLWTPAKGAEMVKEAINLMQMRARSAEESILPGALFNNANSIAYDKAASKQIPVGSLFPVYADILAGGLVVDVVKESAELSLSGIAATELTERIGFMNVRE